MGIYPIQLNMQTLLHRRRLFGDASEGTNDRVGLPAVGQLLSVTNDRYVEGKI
jgi:hypothetical protein